MKPGTKSAQDTQDFENRISALKAQGLNKKEIAARLACSYVTVWRYLKRIEVLKETAGNPTVN